MKKNTYRGEFLSKLDGFKQKNEKKHVEVHFYQNYKEK